MTREKYESLAIAALKDIAKARNIKGISLMKKSELIDAMLALDAKEAAASNTKPEEVGSSSEDKPKKTTTRKSGKKGGRKGGKKGGKKESK